MKIRSRSARHLLTIAVSMQIKRLEQTFDTKLLHREGRGTAFANP